MQLHAIAIPPLESKIIASVSEADHPSPRTMIGFSRSPKRRRMNELLLLRKGLVMCIIACVGWKIWWEEKKEAQSTPVGYKNSNAQDDTQVLMSLPHWYDVPQLKGRAPRLSLTMVASTNDLAKPLAISELKSPNRCRLGALKSRSRHWWSTFTWGFSKPSGEYANWNSWIHSPVRYDVGASPCAVVACDVASKFSLGHQSRLWLRMSCILPTRTEELLCSGGRCYCTSYWLSYCGQSVWLFEPNESLQGIGSFSGLCASSSYSCFEYRKYEYHT